MYAIRSLTLALFLLPAAPVAAGLVNALENGGFEAGSLEPWYQDLDMGGIEDWNVTQSDAHSGDSSGTVRGAKRVRQDFTAVAAADILEVSLWLKQPEIGFCWVTFFYDDGSTGGTFIEPGTSDWEFVILTPALDIERKLNGLGVFGFSDGGLKDRTFVDDILVLVPRTECLEDLDLSGAVDFGDIILILSDWGSPGGPNDLDGDGIVGFGDVLAVLGAWGPCE